MLAPQDPHPSIAIKMADGDNLSRTFFVGDVEAIMDKAATIAHQVLVRSSKRDTRNALADAADFILLASTVQPLYTRTVALVASFTSSILLEYGMDIEFILAFEGELEELAMQRFFHTWAATHFDPTRPGKTNYTQEDINFVTASMFVADLYAASLLSATTFKTCCDVIAKGFASDDHIAVLVQMLSRGNSYCGQRINSLWYTSLSSMIRRRSYYTFGARRLTQMESHLATLLVTLDDDAESHQPGDSSYSKVPFVHEVLEILVPDIIFTHGSFLRGCNWSPCRDASSPHDRYQGIGICSDAEKNDMLMDEIFDQLALNPNYPLVYLFPSMMRSPPPVVYELLDIKRDYSEERVSLHMRDIPELVL